MSTENDSKNEPPCELVQEYVDSSGATLQADAATGVLRGVKLLGLRSRNGRRYAEGALRQAVGLYEGSKVNVNHPERDPLAPRDYRDRLGVVRNVRLEAGGGLYGDLHYNPKHALAEQLAWDAEHAPQNVGLSHNVLARTRREGKETIVEAITRVQSVDLVADPATTLGLFEQAESKTEPNSEPTLAGVQAELREAREQIARLERRGHVETLLRQRGVTPDDPDVLSEAFLRQVLEADEERLDSLVEDRLRLVRRDSFKPAQAREQYALGQRPEKPCQDTAEFVAAVSKPRR